MQKFIYTNFFMNDTYNIAVYRVQSADADL